MKRLFSILFHLGAIALAGCVTTEDAVKPYSAGSASQMERALHNRVNAYRKSRGLSTLAWSDELARHARAHTRSMVSDQRLSHDGYRGRVNRLRQSGYATATENVAYFKGHADPVGSAVDGWRKSPGHHRNMTKPDDRYSGIGAGTSRDGYIYFTQLYGR